MATTEEKQELVDNIKGHRYYRVSLYGYGGEHAYAKLSKEAYDFWKPVVDEHGDTDLVNYFLGAEDGEFEFEDIESVPPEADFLKDDEYHRPWYEMPTEFEHINSVTTDSANIEIDEVDGDQWDSKVIETAVESQSLNGYVNQISEDTDYEIEIFDPIDDLYPEKGTHIVQMLSMEKGTFFDGVIKTVGTFDPAKLKIQYSEAPNGEDVVHGMTYDGEEVPNDGGDTNGKGYAAAVWTQEY